MNEELKPIIEERVDPELEKRALKRTYNRCGWILLVFTAVGYFVPRVIDGFIAGAGDEVKKLVGDKPVKKLVFVPGRLVNIVC